MERFILEYDPNNEETHELINELMSANPILFM
jgi:hypothetical protein